jgi:DNA-binding transcriptional MerR regulator
MRLKRTYSSREVAALTGLSARQLQLWDAGGLLSPAIPSHPTAAGGYTERRYTPIELFELLVLADLRSRGFTVPQLHALLDALDELFKVRLFDATGGGGPVQLLTDGREIYARTERGQFFNLLKTPAQPLLAIGDEGLLRELRGKVRKVRKKKIKVSR